MHRVVRLDGAHADAIALALDPFPDDAPAIITYFAIEAQSPAELVGSVLYELEKAAIGIFPAWLPGSEHIRGVAGADLAAVRALALRTAAATHHFGPFLAELAESAAHSADSSHNRQADGAHNRPAEGPSRLSARFRPEVRAAGLARVLAAGFQRDRAALLVHVPPGLSACAEEVLVAGCEWLVHRGELGVWLIGASLDAVDRVETITMRLPGEPAELPYGHAILPDEQPAPGVDYPALAGRPHPASEAEKALEVALSSRDWATGRAWNQTYRSTALAKPIRVDLLWRAERCVVEVDGPEHRSALIYAADRCRDVQLQLDGYAVLRFTNDQIMTDTDAVARQIERFLVSRRLTISEVSTHAG